MRYLGFAVLCILVLCITTSAQSNCSSMNYVLAGATDSCGSNRVRTISNTYTISCTNNTTSSRYWGPNSSTVTGYGTGCCAPSLVPSVVNASSVPGYNQFYNRAYDAESILGVCFANSAYGFHQDFQQCAAQACPTCTCNKCTGICHPSGCNCPIIMDVFKEGMHLTSLDNGVWFDFNSDGKPLHMAWTDPNYHNAFLALDRNHNGKIDGIQELFGALTQPQIKTAAQPNGWLALADYDTPAYGGNADNVINGEDAIYSQLLLWIDENHDGISQPSELHHLAELGVTAIELKYDSGKSYTDQYGNRFQSRSFIDVGPVLSDKQLPDAPAWDVVLRAESPQSVNSSTQDTLCILQ